MVCHVVYGLRLHTNRLIPGFTVLQDCTAWDIDVHFQGTENTQHSPLSYSESAIYLSTEIDQHGIPVLIVSKLEGNYLFAYSDGVMFHVCADGRNIEAIWSRPSVFEDVLTYLLGPILGFVLRLHSNKIVLHASAVIVNNQVICFVGEAGAGKSTTAAAFGLSGYPVLSDDLVPIFMDEHAVSTLPGHEYIRLWPDSVQMLCGSPDALPLLTPNWEKRFLDMGPRQALKPDASLPLAAIYLLEARQPELAAPLIEKVTEREAFIALTAHSYANNIIDREMRREEFEFLHSLITRVPIRRIVPPADPTHLNNLCAGILEDLAVITTSLLSRHSTGNPHV